MAKDICKKIIKVRKLNKRYPITKGVFKRVVGYTNILKDIDLDIFEGETLAIIGSSGSGKSTLIKTILSLEPCTSGSIDYNGNNITRVSGKYMKELRKDLQIVFQDPTSSLNSRFSVGRILKEPLDIHKVGNSKQKEEKIDDVLNSVGLNQNFKNYYLHELSGGQKQRVAIARSIILEPKVIFLDEPLSALDVSLQKQLIRLLDKLKSDLRLTIILVSHDLHLVSNFSNRVVVLNKGIIEEVQDTESIFKNPISDFTKSLIECSF